MTRTALPDLQARTEIARDLEELGRASADAFARAVATAVEATGGARVIFASAPSQLPLWDQCRKRDDIAWDRVTAFHMDEYVGLARGDRGSLAAYLDDHFFRHVRPAEFHALRGDANDPQLEAARYAELLAQLPIDVCVLGIGENGHIAFNDPPADFETPEIVAVVDLVESGRRQQVGEGHFPTLDDVPKRALTLRIPTLLSASQVIGIVPGIRKAPAVRAALREPLSPWCPASILATRPNATIFLDEQAASLLVDDGETAAEQGEGAAREPVG